VEGPRVVLDTNVLVAAIRSRRGASFRLLSMVGGGIFEVSLSVPLLFEYEDALARHLPESPLDHQDLQYLLDFLSSVARCQPIYFLWRPYLKDPKDDLVLELAVAARCEAVVTHIVQDFGGLERFGLAVYTPGDFLTRLGESS
jgi:putative PIN family toxin of toxin-antitoxin system